MIAELIAQGRDLARFLRDHRERHWAEWLEETLEMLREEPQRGARELLSASQGMGSFQDLVLCPEAGHRVRPQDEHRVNEEFLRQVSNLNRLALAVLDGCAAGGSRDTAPPS